MTSLESLQFQKRMIESPIGEADRAALVAGGEFGQVFTEHMVTVRWNEQRGWHDGLVEPFGPLRLSPAAAVFHYGQEIFEGMKAFRAADGGINLFRVERNAERFAASARRLAMAEVPAELFRRAVEELVSSDAAWVADHPEGTLYLRPFQIATEPTLGMQPAAAYLFGVIASPVVVNRREAPPMRILISDDHVRAVRGGTGDVKCGGNYAASMPALGRAAEVGCDQVLFLDAAERRFVEELGGMNVFVVYDNGSVCTPPLTGTILPGVTRDSIMRLAADRGARLVERPIEIDELQEAARAGRVTEMFACGTVAVVRGIGSLHGRHGEVVIGDGGTGDLTARLRQELLDIQHGRTPDRHGWISGISDARSRRSEVLEVAG
ncbi:branched-chain amino acid aminotransferase [Actinoplanes siamensis]|uniref:Branched-chain-amino-acid aminotransferase n=1 Tax=Actinoplanes siamensis TaxID=1223317 RepID=A0A919NEC9_9ACTN|nr:branched-chain amino acid aminotransferase [Actinoplanes siamensis]GIF09348.1 branched-chain-amino-acid aminotransferase [Actinoplanes siamensis]